MRAPIIASSHTHVGTALPGYHQDWVTHTIHWHGFASLSTLRGVGVASPEFMLLGNQWRLRIYPGGDEIAAEGLMSIDLWNKSNKAIDAEYGFSVNDGNGKQVVYRQSEGPEHFAPMDDDGDDYDEDDYWGFSDFALRSDLMSSLVNGTLVIQVCMKMAEPTKSVPPPFIPENPLTKMIQGLFLNDKYSDIVFEVGGDQRKDNAKKVAKTAPVSFPAHRLIVENCSSIFAELCELHDDCTTIQINDVTPDIFRVLLSYMYGGKVSEDDMVLHARAIIDAADKYGAVNLKLEAEASLVEGTTFTIENVMELLLYADSKNLALLKEAAMDYMMENRDEVLEKLSFTDVPGTFMRDLLAATARGEVRNNETNVHVDNNYNALRISELRKMAHEKGLSVDGSREMLIAALKTVQDPELEVDSDSEESDEDPVEE